MDENVFFREATLRLCGHLDIEKGLRECIKYLEHFMPADSLWLARFELELGTVRVVARATTTESGMHNVLVPLADDGKMAMANFRSALLDHTLPDVFVGNTPESEPVSRTVQTFFHLPLSSVMSLPLFIDGHPMGFLALFAEGNDRFTEKHSHLFHLLKEPFFVAMSNTLKHREVLDLKNLLADDNRYLRGELQRLSGDEIVGASFGLKGVMHKVQKVASLDSPVLLLGETGVGKDVIANAIHLSSPRRDKPFIRVNCGAIPETLIDSELFGHEKGAFTGALSQKRGLFERANRGTILLDEIGDLPLQAQVRLLRVLQNSEIERVGGSDIIKLDIRVLAATHRDLKAMVSSELFREDLWFRLNVFPILIPPVRERRSDVPALLQHFINLKARELKLPAIPKISPGTIDSLLEYNWPGNVREIQNVVERSLILNPKGPLTFDYMNLRKSLVSQDQPEQFNSTDKLDDVVHRHIQAVLSKTDGKIHGPAGAAELLGINPSTLRNRMDRLGIRYGRKGKG